MCGGRAAQAFGTGEVLSSFAGNARKNDGVDALATALAASRNERLAAVDHEAASEVLRLLSERRLVTWRPSVHGRSRQPPRAFAGSRPRRGDRDALGPRSAPRPTSAGGWLLTAGFNEHDPSRMMHNRGLDEGFV